MIRLTHSYSLKLVSALILITFSTITRLLCLSIFFIESGGGNLADKSSSQELGEDILIEIAVLVAFLPLELILDLICLGYGVILRGKRRYFLGWRHFKVGLYFLRMAVLGRLLSDLGSAENYITIVQIIYSILFLSVSYLYEMDLADRCLPLWDSGTETESVKIGTDIVSMVEYSQGDTRFSGLALVAEMVLNMCLFWGPHGKVNDDSELFLSIQDTVMQYVRIGVCFCRFYFSYKERKPEEVRRYHLAYGITLAISLGIFLCMILIWKTIHQLLAIVYFAFFMLTWIYRAGIICLCIGHSNNKYEF